MQRWAWWCSGCVLALFDEVCRHPMLTSENNNYFMELWPVEAFRARAQVRDARCSKYNFAVYFKGQNRERHRCKLG